MMPFLHGRFIRLFPVLLSSFFSPIRINNFIGKKYFSRICYGLSFSFIPAAAGYKAYKPVDACLFELTGTYLSEYKKTSNEPESNITHTKTNYIFIISLLSSELSHCKKKIRTRKRGIRVIGIHFFARINVSSLLRAANK